MTHHKVKASYLPNILLIDAQMHRVGRAVPNSF